MPGYALWALADISVRMSLTSILNPTNPVENTVTLFFTPTNTLTVLGALQVIAPLGFKIRLGCDIEVYQLAFDESTADVPLPNPVCQGELPATNFALVRFQSETAVLGSNVQYQMTLSVSNPEEIPQFPGFWSLESYREVDHRLPNGVG